MPITDTLPRRTASAVLVVAVCVIAANMRTTITGVGPLVDQIGRDTGLSATALGALASVPLMMWALCSPLAHPLTARFGMSRVVSGSIALLLIGTVLRSLTGPSANLWLGSALIGFALAIANVVMPAVIKREFGERVPLMMAVYTALLGGVGAIVSGVVVPLSHVNLGGEDAGWRFALLPTGILLPLALVLWIAAMRGRGADALAPAAASGSGTRTVWRDRVAWLVALYMGVQAAFFYMGLTWISPIALSVGRSEVVAGFDSMIYQITGVLGSFAVPLVLRGRMTRWAPAVLPVPGLVAVVGLMLAPQGVLLWAALGGLSAGSSLGMSLTLMAQRARDPQTSVALSGMSQSVGYIIAAVGPVAFGALHSATAGWTASLVVMGLVLVLQVIVGLAVGRPRYVFDA